MARQSPMLEDHRAAGASMFAYGSEGMGGEGGVWMPESFGFVEGEYAQLRKGALVLDLPSRGTIEVCGDDRVAFLGRMLTQKIEGIEPGRWVRSFWLNKTGRIEADLRVCELGDRMLIDVDVHAAARVVETLDAFVVVDEVVIEDVTERVHRLAVHGPGASALVAGVCADEADRRQVGELAFGRACEVQLCGADVVVERIDDAGEIGLELTVPVDSVRAVYTALVGEVEQEETSDDATKIEDSRGNEGSGKSGEEEGRGGRGGWHAWNMARIEAGTPVYYVDFGPDSLPHETGVLRERVHFAKGCYLGQEVVARMEARGVMKRVLAGLRVEGDAQSQPPSGAGVYASEDDEAKPIGAVSSSTISPMLGGVPVCFAVIKPAQAKAGKQLYVDVGSARVRATVQDGLAFWRRAGA